MLILREDSGQDIKAAYEWYEKQQVNLGQEFMRELESVMQLVEENPGLYATVYGDIRRALCKRFPYAVYFLEAEFDIVVIGIFHQRREPAVWQARK